MRKTILEEHAAELEEEVPGLKIFVPKKYRNIVHYFKLCIEYDGVIAIWKFRDVRELREWMPKKCRWLLREREEMRKGSHE